MQAYTLEKQSGEQLLRRLGTDRKVCGPVLGEDGVCRLQPISRWEEIAPTTTPFLSAKKFLIPSPDILWRLSQGRYHPPDHPEPIALVGLPPCDLQALAYLDEVFAEDALYRRRRETLLVAGAPCSPGPECFCPPRMQPPPFDLFLDSETVWAGSEKGGRALQGIVDENDLIEDQPPECLVQGSGPEFPDDLEERFAGSAYLPLWREVGERCLSCGACSAVCPTCYCYDVVDEALPDGEVTRLREWDNCFFRSHALVSGGHNFRPTRGERLRFRFEHKLLGFGTLRGIPSCVGCGRCGRACPVDIDISEVLDRLLERRAP